MVGTFVLMLVVLAVVSVVLFKFSGGAKKGDEPPAELPPGFEDDEPK